jgi:hypothetical protein
VAISNKAYFARDGMPLVHLPSTDTLMPFEMADAARKRLMQLSLEEDCLPQDLMREALNLLFINRGKPQVA